MKIPLEDQIAMETEHGREMLRVRREVWRKMTGAQRLEKSFRLTEDMRELARAGLRRRYPDASEDEIMRMDADRMLAIHGTSLEEIRRKQEEERKR
ncbi:MAG: hypothetical protein AAFU85_10225 [Planctomycetota bacterium]